MNKNHYKKFAEMFKRRLNSTQNLDQRDGILLVIKDFIELAIQDNPRFDSELFLAKVYDD